MNPKTTTRTLSSEELDIILHLPAGMEGDHTPGDELGSLRSVLDNLRVSASAAANHHRLHASLIPARTFTSRRVWTFATAATLFLCIAAPLSLHRHAAPAPVITTAIRAQAPAVSDEVLYANVQSDIDASVPSPMLPLTTASNTTQSTTKGNAQ